MKAELEQGNIDLLSYQQSVGGSIFNHDHATIDDDDFEDPMMEHRRQKDDEEIIIPELWEIVAPIPVIEVPPLPNSSGATQVTSVPVLPSLQPEVPPVLPSLPHSSEATAVEQSLPLPSLKTSQQLNNTFQQMKLTRLSFTSSMAIPSI